MLNFVIIGLLTGSQKNSVVSFNLTFIWGVPRLLRVNWATENLTGVSFRPVDSSKSSWVSFHELTDVIWWTTFNTDFSTFYWHLNPNHLIYQKKTEVIITTFGVRPNVWLSCGPFSFWEQIFRLWVFRGNSHKFSILAVFTWITQSTLTCCTKVFDVSDCWSFSIPRPDQFRLFLIVTQP